MSPKHEITKRMPNNFMYICTQVPTWNGMGRKEKKRCTHTCTYPLTHTPTHTHTCASIQYAEIINIKVILFQILLRFNIKK
jgi:hypothetical protein